MVYVGGHAVFSVQANGQPPPSFQWQFNGANLPYQTSSALKLTNLNFTDAGAYSVVVSNVAGSLTSHTAWLSVLPTNVVNLGDRELRFGKPSTPIWTATRSDDEGPCVTGDGLALVYASSAPGGSGGHDIWMTSRPTLASPWGIPVNLGPNVNSASNEWDPRLSRDGLSLYFSSDRPGGVGGSEDIWVTTRPSLTSPFAPAVNLGPAVNSSAADGGPQISADNRTLLFTSFRGGGPDYWEVWMTTRTNTLAPWEPARKLAAPINHMGDTFPTEIARDGLLLFFKSWRPISQGNPVAAIYVCRRASQEQPFGPPALIQPILALGAPGADTCTLSDDGTTFYVGSYRTLFPDWPQVHQIDVAPLPQITGSSRGPDGVQFGLVGREGANYEIQRSSDLRTWRPWLTTNTSAGTVQIADPTPAADSRRFYRALSH
jgi:hypothetical protein